MKIASNDASKLKKIRSQAERLGVLQDDKTATRATAVGIFFEDRFDHEDGIWLTRRTSSTEPIAQPISVEEMYHFITKGDIPKRLQAWFTDDPEANDIIPLPDNPLPLKDQMRNVGKMLAKL